MKVLVTGGAGFIGSHLVERLAKRGDQVVALDNFNDFYDPQIKRRNIEEALQTGDVRLCEGDICDEQLVRTLFEQEAFDVVVHLAARAGVRPSLKQPILYERVNCLGTLNLLEATRQFGVSKFVFASSSSVYGGNKKVPFAETDPVERPFSPYAATKRAGELYCWNFHHLYNLSIVCLRFFTVYGPRQRPEMAIHKFTRLIDNGEEVPMFGDGSSRRDYTFIDDIIDGVVAAMEYPCGFEIFNLGESNTISLRELIERIEKALGKKARIRQLPVQPGDVPITFADITKSRALLGYNPQYPVERGIEEFVGWYLKQKQK